MVRLEINQVYMDYVYIPMDCRKCFISTWSSIITSIVTGSLLFSSVDNVCTVDCEVSSCLTAAVVPDDEGNGRLAIPS